MNPNAMTMNYSKSPSHPSHHLSTSGGSSGTIGASSRSGTITHSSLPAMTTTATTSSLSSGGLTEREFSDIAQRQKAQIALQYTQLKEMEQKISSQKITLNQIQQQNSLSSSSSSTSSSSKRAYEEQEKQIQMLRQNRSHCEQLRRINANTICDLQKSAMDLDNRRRELSILLQQEAHAVQHLNLLHKTIPLLSKRNCSHILRSLHQTWTQDSHYVKACPTLIKLWTHRQHLELRYNQLNGGPIDMQQQQHPQNYPVDSKSHRQQQQQHHQQIMSSSHSYPHFPIESHDQLSNDLSSSSSSSSLSQMMAPNSLHFKTITGAPIIGGGGPASSLLPGMRYNSVIESEQRRPMLGQYSPPVGRRPIPIVPDSPMAQTSVLLGRALGSLNVADTGSQEHLVAVGPKVLRRAAPGVKYASNSAIKETYFKTNRRDELVKKYRESAEALLCSRLPHLQNTMSTPNIPLETSSAGGIGVGGGSYSTSSALSVSSSTTQKYILHNYPIMSENANNSNNNNNLSNVSPSEASSSVLPDSGISSLLDSGSGGTGGSSSSSAAYPLSHLPPPPPPLFFSTLSKEIIVSRQLNDRHPDDANVTNTLQDIGATNSIHNDDDDEGDGVDGLAGGGGIVNVSGNDTIQSLSSSFKPVERIENNELNETRDFSPPPISPTMAVADVDRALHTKEDENGSGIGSIKRHHHRLHEELLNESINTTSLYDNYKHLIPKSIAKTILKKRIPDLGEKQQSSGFRVRFQPLTLLLDASLEGDLELVKKVASEMEDVSEPSEDGITALHNSICAGHDDISRFLVLECAANVNAQETDGWTPLHCAASCSSVVMCRLLVENGAALLIRTSGDGETALDKCTEQLQEATMHHHSLEQPPLPPLPATIDDNNLSSTINQSAGGTAAAGGGVMSDLQCEDYLLKETQRLWHNNNATAVVDNNEDCCNIYAIFDYSAENDDEINVTRNEIVQIIDKNVPDEPEWCRVQSSSSTSIHNNQQIGLLPKSFLAAYPVIIQRKWPVNGNS